MKSKRSNHNLNQAKQKVHSGGILYYYYYCINLLLLLVVYYSLVVAVHLSSIYHIVSVIIEEMDKIISFAASLILMDVYEE